jgi:rare lipoprotein A
MALFWGCSSKQEYATDLSAMHRATMRPYTIDGNTYTPQIVKVGEKFRGMASWYGKDYHGKRTSSGEIYNMYDHTAAHKTLPMNTRVRVTNLRNGRSTVVRINDRGPFSDDRIMDLSYAAAKDLGMVGAGVVPVEIEVLGYDSHISKELNATAASTGSSQGTFGALSTQDLSSDQRADETQALQSGYGVQIGSYRRYRGALIVKKRNENVDGKYQAIIQKSSVDGMPLYKVVLVGFESEQEARSFAESGRYPGAFVVRLKDGVGHD